MKAIIKYAFPLVLFIIGAFASSCLEAKPALIADKATKSLLLDIEKLPSGRLVTVGERGHILLSDDEGIEWRQVPVPTREQLTAVDFLDDKRGIAVGFSQTVLLTNDGGESWQLSHQEESYEQPALFDVQFINSDLIIAVGSYGLYLESADGGESWESREIEGLADYYGYFSHFYSFKKVTEDYWVIAGEKYIEGIDDDGFETSSALVAETRDGGETWQKLETPYDGSFFGIQVDDNGYLYVYGLRGNLYISKDQGQSWQGQFLSTASGFHDLAILDSNRWVLVGTGGVLVYKTLTSTDIKKRKDLKGRTAVVAIDDETVIVVGDGGVERLSLSQE
ncbi:WD40/YVTN/BNR-like repeat-containing protein [Kangiella sp. M94]